MRLRGYKQSHIEIYLYPWFIGGFRLLCVFDAQTEKLTNTRETLPIVTYCIGTHIQEVQQKSTFVPALLSTMIE